jgi:AcrR family transcriptional regulator
MPRAFTETETEEIRMALRRAAEGCLARYGVRKTTVSELAKGAGISKGSFYRFFPSKEVLFFHAVEEYQKSLFHGLFQMVEERKLSGRDGLAEAIWYLFARVKDSFLMTLMHPEEMSILLRGLPEEIVSRHHRLDDETTEILLEALAIPETSVKVPLFSTALRTLAMALMHQKEAGSEHFDEAMQLLLRGLVLAGVKETQVGE